MRNLEIDNERLQKQVQQSENVNEIVRKLEESEAVSKNKPLLAYNNDYHREKIYYNKM